MRALTRRGFLQGSAVAAGGMVLPLASASPAFATQDTFEGLVRDGGGQVFDVRNPTWGAKGDTIKGAQTGQMTKDMYSFVQATQGTGDTSQKPPAPIAFTAADINKVLTVQVPEADGGVFTTRIAAVGSDGKSLTMRDPAPATVTNAEFSYGTDDTAAIVAAINAAGDDGVVYFSGGIYTILGASNGHQPIELSGRGGMRGRGGTMVPNAGVGYRDPNTVILCADADAGLLLNGTARYESFMCDGNNIATSPLRLGTVTAGVVTKAPSEATFIDVWVTLSLGNGWEIYGAQSCSFHACGSKDNALDGVHIDGGSSNLRFVHLEEYGNNQYGIHGDQHVQAMGGGTKATTGMRFYSGLCDGAGSIQKTVSKVYLRGAVDWRFPELIMVASNFGPTVDLDQSSCYGIDLSDCRIIGGGQDSTDPEANDVGIQITGNAPDNVVGTFLDVGGCKFTQAVNSISVLGDPKGYRYAAVDGWWDSSSAGAATLDTLPAIDSMFPGRTGDWRTASVLAPWSGTVTYRIMGEDWVQLSGAVTYSGSGTGPVFVLPTGYRAESGGFQVPVPTSAAPGVVSVAATGEVSVAPAGPAPYTANTSVSLDGVSFPVARR
jgi:hypothetical protein